jgi:predicted nucleic-acid-binding Zn-ribbon protein
MTKLIFKCLKCKYPESDLDRIDIDHLDIPEIELDKINIHWFCLECGYENEIAYFHKDKLFETISERI